MLSLTETAAEKVRGLIAEQKLDKNANLRIYVKGGGCSGFSYGMAFENETDEQDKISESNGVRVIVDPVSIKYLEGVEIDWVENGMGGGFKFQNPNAASSCGCGHSFNA
ncbi:MAG: iron-sulfur cluster insertion protein ErpA [Candidatus Marinimicrobia bacterium]|nr:iron-sulfur cluster insertion protein ErpA [Candidatus Neomarinimicrobiota bacterium]MCF7839651.1 iron-sulfur cluster insertion protein ErpA [Candidatus Neomarinimicrobiota bacterium]MCF7902050.1 iron-sulfur cluster insertion protein ErpA [Candidatus Neomarinimicrobiota bacterium]